MAAKSRAVVLVFILSSLVGAACSTANGKTEEGQPAALAISVSPVAATEQPIARFIGLPAP